MEHFTDCLWEHELSDPSLERERKPRKSGLTMVMDKGLGIKAFEDLLQTGGTHIDYIKLGFGTSALYDTKVLMAKINTAKIHDVQIYPGGTFFEIAVLRGQVPSYWDSLSRAGFQTVEISDGTVSFSADQRYEFIVQAREKGLSVITEYGKKLEGTDFVLEDFLDGFSQDLAAGASLVIVEGRESGLGIGIYDEDGRIRPDSYIDLLSADPRRDRILWEAPHKDQQVELLKKFGRKVNLGNIHSEDVFSLEALRRGLRSDTLNL